MNTARYLVLLLLSVGACAEWDNIDSPFDDDPGDGPASCAELDGTFSAASLELAALDDPDLFEDFGGSPVFTTDLDFANELFTSTLTLGDEVFTTTGAFTALDDRLVFTDPFMEGLDDTVVLDCDFDGAELLLSGDVGFDFFDDDFVGFVPSTFAGALTPFSPLAAR